MFAPYLSYPSEVPLMLREILRVLLCVLMIAVMFTASMPAASAGCGGGFGFRPFKALRERFQERRAERQQSAAPQSYQAQAEPDFGPQQFAAQPGPVVTFGIPQPAITAGAVAVFDGRTWKLVETGAPVSVHVNGAGFGVIPPGHHAHVTQDGRTIVHGNENMGNAAAHQGIAYPWVRTGEAGQTVYGIGAGSSSNCPGGVCPVPQNSGRRGLFRVR